MAEEDLNSYEADWNSASTIKSGLKKHTLDSDEEDDGEEKKYEIMEDDDIEGQEDGTGGFDGEVTITPFNMKEEMEEGHFDTEGNYHWKKEGKVIRDNWLENIDWVEIKKQENQPEQEPSDSEDSTPFDQIPTYRKMLTMMKPGESVTKALRRLGGTKSMSASERWRRKKAGLLDSNDENRQQVIDLTELANTLLTETGNMDIYEETYEHISSLVEAADRKQAAAHPKPKSYDDALDMYADDFDEKEKARLTTGSEGSSKSGDVSKSGEKKKHKQEEEENTTDGVPPSKRPKVRFQDELTDGKTSGSSSADGPPKEEKNIKTDKEPPVQDNEVYWEFKWKQESSEVDGPHSTTQMNTWVEEGRFKEQVWVRKVGQNGPFYSSKRVDFELYL